jgi:hypothetical protein
MKKTRMLIASSLILAFSACSGATMVRLTSSQQTPAAEGRVTATGGANNNVRLLVEVHHLARPDLVAPSATAYVVWAQPTETGTTPQNLGAIRVTHDLDGRLDTLTPLHSFDLMITAEPSATVLAPSGPAVMTARVNRS